MTVPLASLLVQETKEKILSTALSIANLIGLDTSTWQPGDPTRTLFGFESEILESLEEIVVNFISSGFLGYAHGAWLKVHAKQVFNVDVPGASFATTNVILTNAGGGVYDIDAGDLTFKSTLSGKTYRNTTGGHLGGLGTLTVTVIADEAGSDSSAGAGEIDDMVTSLLGVTCSNPSAAVGVDEQAEATTIAQCRAKQSSFSPGGTSSAYEFAALSSDLTGTSNISRAKVRGSSTTGVVTVYLAGPSGAVSVADANLAATAMATYVLPLCSSLIVSSAAAVSIPIVYTLYLYKSVGKTEAQITAEVQTALEDLFASRPIGGDVIPPGTTGYISVSMIESTIRALYPQAFKVIVTSPSGDAALGIGEVAVLGVIIPAIVFQRDP